MEPQTVILIIHLIGLAIGIGSATLLDTILMRMFLANGTITRDRYEVIEQASYVVAAGLLITLVSGFAYFGHLYLNGSEIMLNPKVWAKITIVGVLTANGIIVHKLVLPHIRERIGRALFDQTSRPRYLMMISSGSISVVSWYFPLFLGAAREFNFVVPYHHFLLVYGCTIVMAVLSINILKIVASGLMEPRRLRPAPAR